MFMADASQEAIQRLIENSEKGLAQIEMSLPTILETRKIIVEAISEQDNDNVILNLALVVLDSILAENEIIYDISSSLNALLKATDDYPKRYYMQTLNLCFWEASQLLVGGKSDEYGLLTRLEKLTKEINQAGCQFVIEHIINDINEFKKKYTDSSLRNVTRHYDVPTKIYEHQQKLTNIDFFAKGVSQLIAIRMELSVVSSFLLNLLALPIKSALRNEALIQRRDVDLRGMFNDAIFKAFRKKNLEKIVQQVLSKGQKTLDDSYRLYRNCGNVTKFLEERYGQIPDGFKKMESLLLLRMETLYLKYDIACSVWGYLNGSSDMERSQNLRLIHITKQAALTHIYGYNEEFRAKSLWVRILALEEANNETLNTEKVEESLKVLTGNLKGDRNNSNMFAHYRYKDVYYIPARLEAFGKMSHYRELADSKKLLDVCNSLEEYTTRLLYCIDDKQKRKRKKQCDEWITKIDGLDNKIGDNEEAKESLRSIRGIIEQLYSL